VADQARHRVGRHAIDAAALLGREPLKQVIDEQRYVLAPVAQRDELDGHDVEAVVEVLAELPGRDRLSQITVGGGDDAYVTSIDSVRRRGRSAGLRARAASRAAASG